MKNIKSVKLQTLTTFLDNLLSINTYEDIAINGLQLDAQNEEVSRIAYAVDSGLSIVERAVQLKCDMLIVHHGFLWSRCEAIVGPLAKKISLLMKNGISLYAAHLPLDGNTNVGNAAQLGKFLGLSNIQPFCAYKGSYIGIRGRLPHPVALNDIEQLLCKIEGVIRPPLTLPFGKQKIETVCVATGSSAFALKECFNEKIDLFISGEPKQEVYHIAKELECSAIFAGHYCTETFGVRALQSVLTDKFHVEGCWINEPTGI